MDETATDEQVMRALADGDDDALGRLMGRWGGAVWCFIDRHCGYLRCTDDVYQEAWTRVYRYRKRYEPTMPFRPWLFAIAVNCCRTAVSRGRFGPALIEGAGLAGAPEPAAADPAPIDTLIAAEQQDQLHRAIWRLPESQRAVVLLSLLTGTRYKEIALILGRSPGTVRSHMHHALINLRSLLTRISLSTEPKVDHERQSRRQAR